MAVKNQWNGMVEWNTEMTQIVFIYLPKFSLSWDHKDIIFPHTQGGKAPNMLRTCNCMVKFHDSY